MDILGSLIQIGHIGLKLHLIILYTYYAILMKLKEETPKNLTYSFWLVEMVAYINLLSM